MFGYLLTFLANPFNRIDILNLLFQCCFMYLFYIRLKGDSKLTIRSA